MLNKKNIKKILWFISNPKYYFLLKEILKNKIFKTHTLKLNFKKKIISYSKLQVLLFRNKKKSFFFNKKIVNYKYSILKINSNKKIYNTYQKNQFFKKFKFRKNILNFSGAANVKFLYDIILDRRPKNILETGVAFGWSSLAILEAIKKNKVGKLISIDLPYPITNDKSFIGCVVPKYLRKNWLLLLGRDKDKLNLAIKKFNNKIDLFHYDSDKNFKNKYENLNKVWKYMSPKSIFICDDVTDNQAFFKFVDEKKLKYHLLFEDNKYIGIIQND